MAPRPLSVAGRALAPLTRFRHTGGIVLSRTPHVFSHAASHVSQADAAGPSGAGSVNLVYHGGPVLHRSTVHAIFWIPSGYSVGTNYEPVIDGFFQNVADASGRSDNDYSVAAQYGDTSGPSAYQVSFGGSVVDTDPFPANGCTDGPLPVCLTDAQLQAEIDKVIAAQGWKAGLDNEFFIFTPPPVGSCFDASGSYCAYSYYCAYHGSFTSSLGNGTVVYANQPYAAQPAAPGSCDTGARPNGDDADPTINLISHEQIESITDPLLNAWFDASGYEIGDKCVWNFGPNAGDNEQIGTGHYSLQQEWSNQTFNASTGEQGSCVQRDMPQLVLTGTGDGSVSRTPGATCNAVVCDLSGNVGDAVTLTAQPASGSSFLGWQGDCSGTGACAVTVTPTTSVIARFRAAQLPAGWAEEPLTPPAGTDPLPPGADPSWSFYRAAESAEGGERAITMYHSAGFCSFTGDTGGIYLQRQTNRGWVADGRLTAPAVGSDGQARWANCAGFGAEISLSADGSTLLASQDMTFVYPGEYRCAAFVYERTAAGWTQAGTLFPPGIGPAGSPSWDGCDYFGINSTLSTDGMRAAVLSSGRVDIFVHGSSGWSLEQHLVVPSGNDCSSTIESSRLAISGNGSRLLVADPDCDANGVGVAGRVYDYERVGSSWSLAQTIDSPEPIFGNHFGQGLALSNDGNTAAITEQEGTGLPYAGAVWVYEHTQSGWQQGARLTTTTPEPFGFMTCPQVSSDGSTIVCSAVDQVGFDPAQGSVYVFQRPGPSWTSAPTPLRLVAADGHAQDYLGTDNSNALSGLTSSLAVSPDGGDIAATIAPQNVDFDGGDRIGYEFTTAPVVRSFTPARAAAGAPVTIRGANFSGATAVTFDGVAAASFTVDSPTEVTAIVPATAGIGSIGVTTTKGRSWSSGSFSPLPSIESFAPRVGTAGTRVTIAGANLLGATAVEFGGVPAASFDAVSATVVTAVVPATAATGELTVVTPDGHGSSSTPFRPEPSIDSFAPNVGIAGTRVRIAGANLLGATAVEFGGVPAAGFDVVSATVVTAVVPATAATGELTVVTPGGTVSSSTPFLLRPVIESLVPREAPAGTPVRIEGTNLGDAASVWLTGRKLRFVRTSPSSLTVWIPRQARGGHLIVDSPTGRAVSLQRFQPEPSVASVPHSVRPGAQFTIAGGNLAGTFRVRVDGRRARFHVVSPTLVVATLPLRARRGRITVWTWGGTVTTRIIVRGMPSR